MDYNSYMRDYMFLDYYENHEYHKQRRKQVYYFGTGVSCLGLTSEEFEYYIKNRKEINKKTKMLMNGIYVDIEDDITNSIIVKLIRFRKYNANIKKEKYE